MSGVKNENYFFVFKMEFKNFQLLQNQNDRNTSLGNISYFETPQLCKISDDMLKVYSMDLYQKICAGKRIEQIWSVAYNGAIQQWKQSGRIFTAPTYNPKLYRFQRYEIYLCLGNFLGVNCDDGMLGEINQYRSSSPKLLCEIHPDNIEDDYPQPLESNEHFAIIPVIYPSKQKFGMDENIGITKIICDGQFSVTSISGKEIITSDGRYSSNYVLPGTQYSYVINHGSEPLIFGNTLSIESGSSQIFSVETFIMNRILSKVYFVAISDSNLEIKIAESKMTKYFMVHGIEKFSRVSVKIKVGSIYIKYFDVDFVDAEKFWTLINVKKIPDTILVPLSGCHTQFSTNDKIIINIQNPKFDDAKLSVVKCQLNVFNYNGKKLKKVV